MGSVERHLALCGPLACIRTPLTTSDGQKIFCIPVTGKFWIRDLDIWAEGRQFHKNEEVETVVRKTLRMRKPYVYRDGIFHSC
jgi:hypothetical protein